VNKVDEDSQRLKYARSYCLDRLGEVKADIANFQKESVELKARLEMTTDEIFAGQIRSRRRFLSRRLDELKAERSALAKELEEANVRLNIPVAETARHADEPVNTESPSHGGEEPR
jgi:hypothetical protein